MIMFKARVGYAVPSPGGASVALDTRNRNRNRNRNGIPCT